MIDKSAYYKALNEDTGCEDYQFSTTPFLLKEHEFNAINEGVSLLLDCIDTPEYYKHCLSQEQWSLPIFPMKRHDYLGCADFLLTDKGAKLIEMNMNFPGKVGIMQALGEAAKNYLDDKDACWTNLDFNTVLCKEIKKVLGNSNKIAVLVSHFPSSQKHYHHYNYFSKVLNQLGLSTKVVPANEIKVTASGCEHKGENFDGFINLVIPFVWEDNPEEFSALTDLLELHHHKVYPNPTGGMLGTKDLLNYLSKLKQESNNKTWGNYVLDAYPLSELHAVSDLYTKFNNNQFVLKPFKDYNASGVYVNPEQHIVNHVFKNKKTQYMAQEFTNSLELPFLLPSGEEMMSHSVIYRVYFASKKPMGYQGYYIKNLIDNTYVSAPVKVVS